MIRKRMLVALALLGFISSVLGSAAAPLPTAAHIAQQPLPITPTLATTPPDRGGARGFEPGAATDPYTPDLRAESLLDN